jgi:hypothetical protein
MNLIKLVAIVFCLLVTSGLLNAQVPQDYRAARDIAPSLSNLLGGGNSGGGIANLFGGGNNSNGGGVMGGLQKLPGLQGLLPAVGASGQNQNVGTDLLSRLNQSSKSLVDKTTGWARQKKQEMTQKMLGNTLGNLLPGLNQQQPQTKSAFDWLKPKAFQTPAQPPLRSAQNYDQQPGIRY